MKEFDTEKWFCKFEFDQKKGNKNELGCTKIADIEQIQGWNLPEPCREVFYM